MQGNSQHFPPISLAPKVDTRPRCQETVQQYMARGGVIQVIPFGMSATKYGDKKWIDGVPEI